MTFQYHFPRWICCDRQRRLGEVWWYGAWGGRTGPGTSNYRATDNARARLHRRRSRREHCNLSRIEDDSLTESTHLPRLFYHQGCNQHRVSRSQDRCSSAESIEERNTFTSSSCESLFPPLSLTSPNKLFSTIFIITSPKACLIAICLEIRSRTWNLIRIIRQLFTTMMRLTEQWAKTKTEAALFLYVLCHLRSNNRHGCYWLVKFILGLRSKSGKPGHIFLALRLGVAL